MSDLSVVDDVKKMLMQGAFNSNGFPMPFTKEIFLVACHVAGTGYRDVKTFEPELKIDNFLGITITNFISFHKSFFLYFSWTFY